ncbi:DUF5691 domain-containing protein [Nocardia sp. 004]|uniref:DUF5691 domain-containing protein n=1 Tax=Nocardia sp. 004 TaxID=3385978 RepID=UPI0039A3B652
MTTPWTEDQVTGSAPDTSSLPATAERRSARVRAGLAELDVWLTDQVRTGLAESARSYHAFETIAARMIDAQAPGPAAVLRRLPAIVATRTDWPDILLREYARLHLLIAAHRQLDAVSPALRASIRSHIGYPYPIEAVRTEPPVRDQWMVVGLRITEEARLHTRRSWLYGRTSRRWALLVEHSFGSPSFATDLPALGRLVDAQLHFYPGSVPLRAVWGERYGADEPGTALPHSDNRPATIATELAEHAAALGADPWLRSWPMLLADVVPTRTEQGWYITESDGKALPIRDTEQPWTLLAVSGGHPVTVVGEWNADGLTPLSVYAEGEVLDLVRVATARETPRHVPAEQAISAELTAAALLGTARRAPELTAVAPPIPDAAHRLPTDPALLLLETTALQDLFVRGGMMPATAPVPEQAAPDTRRLLPRPSAARLTRMLRERSPFLLEWFATAAPHDYRAPAELCEQLLEYAQHDTNLRDPALRLAGVRGDWLAARHPIWRDSARQPSPLSEHSTDTWHFGKPHERSDWLAELRRRDAAAARQQLAAAWPKESGPLKAELLTVLAEGLAPEDESLLEPALDDRRADVRRTAARLLALLPGSAFAQRMRARAAEWIRAEQRLRRTHLLPVLPDTLDAAAQRDGITDRTAEFSYRWDGIPDITAIRLRHLVAATPPPYWTELLGSPTQAVRTTIEDRYRQPIFDGWMDAALQHRDPTWARALFESGVPTDLAILRRRELFALLPLPDRTAHLVRLDGSWLSELEALLPAVDHPWPEALARHVLVLLSERARVAAGRPNTYGTGPDAHRSLIAAAAAHFPVAMAGALTAVAHHCADPGWERAFDRLAHDLDYRSKMLEELQ